MTDLTTLAALGAVGVALEAAHQLADHWGTDPAAGRHQGRPRLARPPRVPRTCRHLHPDCAGIPRPAVLAYRAPPGPGTPRRRTHRLGRHALPRGPSYPVAAHR